MNYWAENIQSSAQIQTNSGPVNKHVEPSVAAVTAFTCPAVTGSSQPFNATITASIATKAPPSCYFTGSAPQNDSDLRQPAGF